MRPPKHSLEKLTRFGQQGNPSSHWTIALASHGFGLALALVAVVHVFLIFSIPLVADELYYWSWAQSLQWSYYDHPPMVALLIRFSCAIFGDNAFGIRFFGLVFSIISMWAISTLCQTYSVLLFVLFTPLVFYVSTLMTPDTPLIFFWTLYFVWVVRVNQHYREWNDDPITRVYHQMPVGMAFWILGGILLGLGLLSKYTMGLAVICSALLFVVHFRMRAWLPGYFLHLAIATFISSPILIFNIRHDFIPLLFQWNHGMTGATAAAPMEFMEGQWILVGGLPIILLPWTLARFRRITLNPTLHACWYFFAIPFCFFLFMAFRKPLEGNWPLIAYGAFWPIAQFFFQYNSFRLLGSLLYLTGFGPALAASLILFVHTLVPLKWIPIEKDRVTQQKAQFALAEQIAQDAKQEGYTLFLPTYQWTSYFRFFGVPSEQLFPAGRPSHFTMTPKSVCDYASVLVLEVNGHKAAPLSCFDQQKVVGNYEMVVRNAVQYPISLVEYRKAATE